MSRSPKPSELTTSLAIDHHGQLVFDTEIVSIDDFLPLRFTTSQMAGGQVVIQRKSASDPKRPVLHPCLGFEQVINHELKCRGFAVARRGRAIREVGMIAENTRSGNRHVAQFVKNNALGLVEFAPNVDRTALLVELVQLLPEATFAFATVSKTRARHLYDQFRKKAIPATIVLSNRSPRRVPGRIVVGTFPALGHSDVDCNKRDVFVIVDAPDALHAAAEPCLTQADFNCRLFGLVSTVKRLSPGERDRLATIFGFERLTIPAPGVEEVLPVVVPWKYRGGAIPKDATPEQVVQELWRDGQRNRVIGKVAKQAISGDRTSTGSRFQLSLCDQVILLAGSVKQAARFGTRLRDWPIRTAEAFFHELPRFLKRSIERGQSCWSTGNRWITTTQATGDIELQPGPGLTVVVWAGAGRSLPPLPASWLTIPVGSGRKLLLVDVEDRHHAVLRRWTQSRRRAYVDAEWLSPGVSVVNHRIEAFLNRRRRERNG